MNWRQKSAAYGLIDLMPFSNHMFYLLQRYVTKSLPRSNARIKYYVGEFKLHIGIFEKYNPNFKNETWFGFGTGWDFCENLVFHRYGLKKQITVDLNRLARADLVNAAIAMLNEALTEADMKSEVPISGPLEAALLARFGIDYRAPSDARATGLAAGAVDICSTTNTLEHIPFDSLRGILVELHRIMRPGGTVSMLIDYSDHYAAVDSSINVYNFLQYSEKQWRKYNHDRQFQSRRRHVEYVRLHQECGFELLEQQVWRPENYKELLLLQPIHADFAGFSQEEISATRGLIVARRV